MAFGDVKTAQGLNELNKFLADKSYVSGYVHKILTYVHNLRVHHVNPLVLTFNLDYS